MLLSAFGILATLLPALGVALTGGHRAKERLISPEHVFAGIVFYAGLWLVLFQSLTFGPSVGTTPQADDTGPPQPMESMVLEASEIVDNRYLHGRGGLIGDLSLAGFRRMEAQGNPEQALFSSRRPYHSIPLSVYMVLHLAVYLSAVTAVSFCAMQLSWPTGRVFLLGLLWSGLVYAPSIHWLWRDGWLLFRGAIDGGGACFLLVVSSSMAVVGYRKNPAGSTPPVDTGTANHHLWNGQQIRSLLHGPTDLLIGQSIASLALIAYPAIITWILKSLCGYWLLPQNEE